MNNSLELELENELNEAEAKAWDALNRYKFQMFGYWAAIWVHLNKINGQARPNPFRDLVRFSRQKTGFMKQLQATKISERSKAS